MSSSRRFPPYAPPARKPTRPIPRPEPIVWPTETTDHFLSHIPIPFRDAAHAVEVFRRLGQEADFATRILDDYGWPGSRVTLGPVSWTGPYLDQALRAAYQQLRSAYPRLAQAAEDYVGAETVARDIADALPERPAPRRRF